MDAPPPESILASRVGFLLELGRALQRYGAPAHRLEEALGRVARRLGLESDYFCVPTAFFAFLGEPGSHQRAYLERTPSGDANLAKLSDMYAVARDVALGRVEVEAAHRRLKELLLEKPPFGPWAQVAAGGLASAMSAILFGGGWIDVLYAGLLGLLGGMAPFLARLRPVLGGLTALMGAFLVSLGSGLLAATGWPCSPAVVTLAGLICFLPGLGLVVAMNELATGHLVSGATRLAGVGMAFLQLAFGVLLGHQVCARWFHLTPHPAPPVSAWMAFPVVAAIAFAFLVIFQARLRDYGWVLLACSLSVFGARLAGAALGGEFGVGLGAFGLGVAANLFSRRYDRPSLLMVLPGLILLVPGSWGFRSLDYIIVQDQAALGINTAVHMAALAMALVVGLLLANAVVRPRMVL